MSLWVDKYRPTSLDQMTYHKDISSHLKNLSNSGDLPHLLFYGPSGAGKKTRITATLREIFGPGVEKIKIDQRQFQTPSNRKIDINTISSSYHIEINPSDVGIYDRVVIQDLIKEAAQTQQLSSKATRKFKVIVIHEADSLSKDAQHALRRTMEKYVNNLRVILCCNSTGKIIGPVQSRCLLVRIPAPSVQDIVDGLCGVVAKKEKITVPTELATHIAVTSKRNMRRAVLMLESSYVQQYPFTADQNSSIPLPDWEIAIIKIAKLALEDQSPQQLLKIRGLIYELLSHCIPAQTILKHLAFYWIKSVDNELKTEMAVCAATYEHRLQIGQKAIFHLEAYVAKFMSIYKRFLLDISSI
ncbi:Replication factor C (RF-C) subunit [Mycoemilia scoparia]|uniref:Replication factor C subunit 5 n=1 Tax=Mycoemilia scoparia TaxID=417184 RepID=A0A9W8A342_9FUNG|nr:Replication factor C (RF-C) subunit [Mycoemilia scoparia]